MNIYFSIATEFNEHVTFIRKKLVSCYLMTVFLKEICEFLLATDWPTVIICFRLL